MEKGERYFLPEGQTVKDVVVKRSTEYSNGQTDGTSAYIMTGKDGKKTYFAEDGRILGIVDRYGNQIMFEYSSLNYTTDGQYVTKRLISKITDSIGRVVTMEYPEDHSFKVGPITASSYTADNYYLASQNPNNTDSGDLQGKFQVIIHLPDNKTIVYDKSAVLVTPSKQVVRTRMQRVYGTDQKPKYHFWYEQPDLGFTFSNGKNYSAYNRYENLVQISDVAQNRMKRYTYNSYTKGLSEGSMQYRKIFERQDVIKQGYDPAASNFLERFKTDVKEKDTYAYTNEADGYGVTGYKESDEAYLKDSYRYTTLITDSGGSTTQYTFNGKHEMIVTEKQGKNHRQVMTNEHDEMKLVKKQETDDYAVVDGKSVGEPVKKITNYRYDEYGNLTNYVGPEAERDDKGNPINNEHLVVYSYAYDKFHALSQKVWKQDAKTTRQIQYDLDAKGDILSEKKSTSDSEHPWDITDYAYDTYGNTVRKTVHSDQERTTYYEYGRDANGADTQGAYLTKSYQIMDGKEIALTYAYDMKTGNLVFETDAKGTKTAYEYDALSRVTKRIIGDSRVLSYRYLDNSYSNFQIDFTDPNGNQNLYEYDITGSLVKQSVLNEGAWHVTQTVEYDSFGNITKLTDANGHSWRYEYDSSKRLIRKTAYENDKVAKGTQTLDYRVGVDKAIPLQVTLTDEEGYSQKLSYDIREQLVKQEVTPDRTKFYTTQYDYDYVGNLISSTDAKGHTTRLEYNHQGKVIKETDALGYVTTRTYNTEGNPLLIQEATGKITEYGYDTLGRQTSQKLYQQGTNDYFYSNATYDAVGNVTLKTEGAYTDGKRQDSSRIAYAYNAWGQLTDAYPAVTETVSGHTQFENDKNGNVIKSVDYADTTGTLKHVKEWEYNSNNKPVRQKESLQEIRDGKTVLRGSSEVKWSYDYAGNLLSEQLYNGSGYDTTSYTYNHKNQILTKTAPFHDKEVRRTTYAYDKVGNVTAETKLITGAEATTTYIYDGLGKKTGEVDPMGNLTRYEYDAKGNLTKAVDPRYFDLPLASAPGMVNEYDDLDRLVKTYAFDGQKQQIIQYLEYAGNRKLVRKKVEGTGYNAKTPEKSIGMEYEYNVLDKPVRVVSARLSNWNDQKGTNRTSKLFTYDGSGNVLTETDALDRLKEYRYNLQGKVTQILHADGSMEKNEYDLTGNLYLVATDKAGYKTYEYRTLGGKPYRKVYPDGTQETFRYSVKNELLEQVDPLGQSTFFTYDSAGNVVMQKRFIQTDGNRNDYKGVEFQYNETGKMLSQETLLITEMVSSGKQVSRTSAQDLVENTYDKAGRLIRSKGLAGKEVKREYDRAGNLITELYKVSSNEYAVTRMEYDERSRLMRKSLLVKTSDIGPDYLAKATFDSEYADRVLVSTQYRYDDSNRVIDEIDPMGFHSRYEYDDDGNRIKKVDPLGGTIQYEYDDVGNLIRETNARHLATQYEYDDMNQLIRKTAASSDGSPATTRYVYDAMGNLIREIAPNQYDKDKDLSGQWKAMSGTSYLYDRMNRQTAVFAPDGTGTRYIAYDAAGRIVKEANGIQFHEQLNTSPGLVYSYNGLDQVIQQTDALGHVTKMEYNVLGHLVKQVDARGSETKYESQPDGALLHVSYADGGTTSYTYDQLGNRLTETDSLGNTTTYSYNAFGKEKSRKDALGASIEYRYDLNGNVVSEKDKRGYSTLFTYDGNGRLSEKRIPFQLDASKNIIYTIETYQYDENGNILQKAVRGSRDDEPLLTTSYTYFDNDLVKSEADSSGANTQFEYDKNGNLIRTTRLRDSQSSDVQGYEYDSQNRLAKSIRFLDEQDVESVVKLPNISALRDPEQPGKIRQITGYSYDAMGNMIQEIDPRAYGYPSSDDKAVSRYTITYSYDLLGQLETASRMVKEQELVQQYTYDANGNKLSSQDERGNQTRYSYDSLNRLITTTDAANRTLTRKYDKSGNKIAETNAKGDSITYTYDPLNRLSLTLDPHETVISKNIYDANGNVIKKIDAEGYASASTDEKRYGTEYTYNLNNQMVTITDPVTMEQTRGKGVSVRYAYDALGRVVREEDALGNSKRYVYDAAGRVTKVTEPSGSEFSYEYDRVGNKTSMKDGRGKLTQYEYGSFGLLRKVTDAANTSEQYTYDLAMNRQVMTDRLGHHTVSVYDARNLLLETRVTETGDQIQYDYDQVGNRVKMTDESGTRTYAWNPLNQLLNVQQDGKSEVDYTYDEVGNIQSVTDRLGNKTVYAYDMSNRMVEVTYGDASVRYAYDKNGNRTTVTHSGGVKEQFRFDKNNRLTVLTNQRPDGSVISSYTYTYDANGRQSSRKDDYGTTTYTYDEDGRITRVVTPGKTTVYAYDGSNNRLSMQETYASEQPITELNDQDGKSADYRVKKSDYVYSDASELLQVEERMLDANGQERLRKTLSYLYDANGNQVSQRTSYLQPSQAGLRPSTGGSAYGETGEIASLIEKVSYTYDGFNRMKSTVKVKNGNRVTVDYRYDGEGLRREKTIRSSKDGYQAKITKIVYDRQYVILETDGSGKLSNRYIRGVNYVAHIGVDGQAKDYLYNGHGDVVQTVTESGEVQNRYDYDIFGNPTLSIEVHEEAIRYAGEFYDGETGLYYLRARYYDPAIGRFITKDSYWGEEKNPLSLNLYTYAHNDPIRFIDPTGHWAEGDSKMNVEAQAKILALTTAYYNAIDNKERLAVQEQANAIRKDPSSYHSIVTPLQFDSKIIENTVKYASSQKRGMTKEEWYTALERTGIIEIPGKESVHRLNSSKSAFARTTSLVFGKKDSVRTVISVNTGYTINRIKKDKYKGFASIDVSYDLTPQEAKFIQSVSLDRTYEQNLVILMTLERNNGNITRKQLEALGIKVKKGVTIFGFHLPELMSVEDTFKIPYNFSKEGKSTADANLIYQIEEVNERLAEAYGLMATKMISGGARTSSKRGNPLLTVTEEVESRPNTRPPAKGTGKITGSLNGLTEAEKKVVNDLTASGKNVEIIPKDPNSKVKTPDFKVDGVKTELKTLENPNVNTGITRIQKGLKQGAETVIIDARDSGLTTNQAREIITRASGTYPNKTIPGKVEIWTNEGIITYP
ncbi:RHS repeat-associated core domain-containing protein [Gorillibacterium sp. CAU 1737]|uniref:RHS repeat-associated core domain-containing protein n=1 Tax=Gorillibacterium sp. CAU 1737 TaxID=3140362 RepID=UPI0032611410